MATRRVAIVVHSDAAKSCIRFSFILRLILVARMKAVSDATVVVYLLRSLCQIHQLMLGIYAMNNTTRHVGTVFCGTSLIRRGVIWDRFIQELQPAIESVYEVSFDAPTQEEAAYMNGICELILFWKGNSERNHHLQSLRNASTSCGIHSSYGVASCIIIVCLVAVVTQGSVVS